MTDDVIDARAAAMLVAQIAKRCRDTAMPSCIVVDEAVNFLGGQAWLDKTRM